MLLFLLSLYLSFGIMTGLILCGLILREEPVDISLLVKIIGGFALSIPFWPALVYCWWNE